MSALPCAVWGDAPRELRGRHRTTTLMFPSPWSAIDADTLCVPQSCGDRREDRDRMRLVDKFGQAACGRFPFSASVGRNHDLTSTSWLSFTVTLVGDLNDRIEPWKVGSIIQWHSWETPAEMWPSLEAGTWKSHPSRL